MTKIEKLLARQDALLEEMRALADKDEITDEDNTKYDTLEKEYDSNELAIKRLKDLEARETEANKPVNTPRVTVKEPENDKPFKTFGEQMLAIVKAGRPGGEIDPRLLQVQAA
ncbi:MAG: hypothetical protein PHW65_06965, partial [Dehalococcoidales bacterium]|nr:hypothetical protein [Dehalococcoidales bacterium]